MAENVIYRIRNLINEKFYVGSTRDTAERFRQHRRKLRGGKHHCRHLQAAWNKYGEEKFIFEVVEQCGNWEDLEAAEDRWLEQHFGRAHCYNSGISSRAPWRGVYGAAHPQHGRVQAQGTKDKLSDATKRQWETSDPRTGQTHSTETKAKISAKIQIALSEGRGGKFIPDADTRKKMSDALKGNQNAAGHVRSEEHRQKLSEANMGNQHWLGKSHSEESKAKMGKPVRMIAPDGTVTVFPRTTAIKEQLGIFLPTVLRSVRSGAPLSKGRYAGHRFEYV